MFHLFTKHQINFYSKHLFLGRRPRAKAQYAPNKAVASICFERVPDRMRAQLRLLRLIG